MRAGRRVSPRLQPAVANELDDRIAAVLEIVLPNGVDDARHTIRVRRRTHHARFQLQAARAVVDADPVNRVAAELIVQTAVGSARMLRESGEHPVLLREAVTSPGGTTISAIRTMEDHGVRAAMLAAEDVVRDAGFTRIGLQVLSWNRPAVTLYRSLGYQVDATTMSKPVGS